VVDHHICLVRRINALRSRGAAPAASAAPPARRDPRLQERLGPASLACCGSGSVAQPLYAGAAFLNSRLLEPRPLSLHAPPFTRPGSHARQTPRRCTLPALRPRLPAAPLLLQPRPPCGRTLCAAAPAALARCTAARQRRRLRYRRLLPSLCCPAPAAQPAAAQLPPAAPAATGRSPAPAAHLWELDEGPGEHGGRVGDGHRRLDKASLRVQAASELQVGGCSVVHMRVCPPAARHLRHAVPFRQLARLLRLVEQEGVAEERRVVRLELC
jgi:hypothetical protein